MKGEEGQWGGGGQKEGSNVCSCVCREVEVDPRRTE